MLTQDDDFRKKIKSKIRDKDCYDLLRGLFGTLCGKDSMAKLRQISEKLPQATASKLNNLLYTKNVILSDGEPAVRKIYKVRTLSEMTQRTMS